MADENRFNNTVKKPEDYSCPQCNGRLAGEFFVGKLYCPSCAFVVPVLKAGDSFNGRIGCIHIVGKIANE